jgi:hypothetical protein
LPPIFNTPIINAHPYFLQQDDSGNFCIDDGPAFPSLSQLVSTPYNYTFTMMKSKFHNEVRRWILITFHPYHLLFCFFISLPSIYLFKPVIACHVLWCALAPELAPALHPYRKLKNLVTTCR